ncbi:hypothetical protein LTR78_000072 [Recurvomyces mirabilis]|uniref:SRR1-like domain-containing protein n=1 Tax=Recurvomyces mirabilis TaxID=574656 RepID=A0AAE0WXG6_9PEZI|nr:hypothetical protein LTR78_000072 [Recurvomyces mirabilis]KAK5161728.1 hypothetical protein LTS14_000073 [Recurvomyces mirabilis]
MSHRKLGLPALTRAPAERVVLEGEGQISPDHAYNIVARRKGLAKWPVETFRRLSLRSEADPTFLNVEKASRRYARIREEWVSDPSRQYVVDVLRQHELPGGWQIGQAFCLGLSSNPVVDPVREFKYGLNATRRLLQQLVYFLDVFSLVSEWSQTTPRAFVQELERDWTELEQEMLMAHGAEAIRFPTAEENVTRPDTFVYLPCTPYTTSADLLGRCLPLQPTIALLNADYVEEEGVENDKPTAIRRLRASFQRALEIDDWLAAEGVALDDGADEEGSPMQTEAVMSKG